MDRLPCWLTDWMLASVLIVLSKYVSLFPQRLKRNGGKGCPFLKCMCIGVRAAIPRQQHL